MSRIKHIINFLIAGLILSSHLSAIVPDPPVLKTLTVESDGQVKISWLPVTDPAVAGYIVYLLISNEGFAIDTIFNPAISDYRTIASNANWFSESYVVAAIDTAGNASPLSNSLTTVYLSATADTCSSNVKLKWNRVVAYGGPLSMLRVMVSENGTLFTEEGELESGATSSELTYLAGGYNYCIRIEGIRNDSVITSSNISCATSGSQKPPAWITLNELETTPVGDNIIQAEYDPAGDINRFRLESRSHGSQSFISAGETVASGGMVSFTSANNNTITTTYRISAVNACNNLVSTSNELTTIKPASEFNDGKVLLTWNMGRSFSGQLTNYEVLRNSGSGFATVIIISDGDTTYTDDYLNYYGDVSSSDIFYRIIAHETGNPFSSNGRILSGVTSIPPFERISAANAFTPNGDMLNDTFSPILSFTPTDYNLEIRSKDGNFIYRSSDWRNGWDGTGSRGEILPPDVYLWFLNTRAPSGNRLTRQGTISILP